MSYYYWSPAGQQYATGSIQPGQQVIPPATSGGTMQTGGAAPTMREESYIENILRLNRGKPGTFHFTVPEATGGSNGNTISVRGVVEAAGRDHAIIRELQTNHRFLFPMIYFD